MSRWSPKPSTVRRGQAVPWSSRRHCSSRTHPTYPTRACRPCDPVLVNHGQVTRRHDLSDAGRDFVQPSLPGRRWAGPGPMTGRGSTASCESSRQKWPGAMYPGGTDPGPVCTPASATGGGRHVRPDAEEAQARADAAGNIDWLVSADSSVVRAHHHAVGARESASQPGSDTAASDTSPQNARRPDPKPPKQRSPSPHS